MLCVFVVSAPFFGLHPFLFLSSLFLFPCVECYTHDYSCTCIYFVVMTNIQMCTCTCIVVTLHITVEQAYEAINYSLHSGNNPQATLHALQSEFAGMVGIIRPDCADRYYAALRSAQEEKGRVCISCVYELMYT